MLLDYGAPMDVKNNAGMTPLLKALEVWDYPIYAKLLLMAGASLKDTSPC